MVEKSCYNSKLKYKDYSLVIFDDSTNLHLLQSSKTNVLIFFENNLGEKQYLLHVPHNIFKFNFNSLIDNKI